MKNLHRVLFFALSIIISGLNAQNNDNQLESINSFTSTGIDFTNQNNLISSTEFNSILIVGITDMDGDGLDDIIRLKNGQELGIVYQKNGNQFENYSYGYIDSSPQWNIAVADVDQNGFNDILIGGIMDGMKLLKANDSGSSYEESTLPASSFFSQGSNFSDIDNDGDVDVFVCNDMGDNQMWENDGSGIFLSANGWIDMSTIPSSDNSGNYASVWTDFDNDCDLDLYISKCKAGITNPTDPRRVNQLFVNDNGVFTESAAMANLKNGAQSWTTDFQDIDNDGDLDCFMVNHDSICQLFENDGTGVFTNLTFSSGLNITTNHLQGLMRDFDNDGFVDILVAGNFGYEYFENNGNSTFQKVEGLFGNYLMSTFTVGDLNHDGFMDIYSGSLTDNDVLWINDHNDNHFFAVDLVGESSNINAIGARIELHGSWGTQLREIRSGESYGIMNSFIQIFGLGTANVIDSLVVKWPTGQKEVFESPQIDQFLTVVENDCAYPGKNIFSNSITTVCSGDSLEIVAPAGDTYLWSNGIETQTNWVSSAGTYDVTVTNNNGCSTISNVIQIDQDPDETPFITVSGPVTFCAGGSVILFSSEAESYQWSNGPTTSSTLVFQAGEYEVTVPGFCHDFTSDPVIVTIIDQPEEPTVENDTITSVPGVATLKAEGDNLLWYNSLTSDIVVGSGTEFVTPELLETTSYFVQDTVEFDDVICESNRVEVLAVIDTTTSLQNFEALQNISIFPVPASDEIVVDFKLGTSKDVILNILDINGRVVFSKGIEAGNNPFSEVISVSNIPSGFYCLSIHSNDKACFKKLIIQRK